jgi:hypothetical protein
LVTVVGSTATPRAVAVRRLRTDEDDGVWKPSAKVTADAATRDPRESLVGLILS